MKKMSQKKFFEALEMVAEERPFILTKGDGHIRTRSGKMCPICAVAQMVTGKKYDNSNYDDAYEALGLDQKFGEDVVYAADNCPTSTDWEKARKKLLKAVGLTEAKVK